MVTKKPTSKLPQYLYKKAWPPDAHPADIELACFLMDHRPEKGGLGKFMHFKRALMYRHPWLFQKTPEFPESPWNSWLDLQLRSLCDPKYEVKVGDTSVRFVNWTGCGAAGKTFASGLFAHLWWRAAPGKSSVTLTSTSKQAIGQRVWPVIQKIHRESLSPWTGHPELFGNIVDSMKKLQAVKGDDKHAIHALAVEKGELQKAVNGMKGRHTERMMLIIDEANTVPIAALECIPNMSKGCKEIIILVIGNAVSRFDAHGRACAPKDGWDSITIENESWLTKGDDDLHIDPGVCVHFDGEKSPNVMRKKTLWPFLYSYENFLRSRHKAKTIQYWSQERGFWPSDGIVNTVLSEVMIQKYDATGKFTFVTYSIPVAFLDPAFGGDQCVARFGYMGDVDGNKLGILLTETIVIDADVESEDQVDYQIARRFIDECQRRQVDPKYAGIDSTGIGRGVYAITATEWSSRVNRVEYGGAASDMPASEDDSRASRLVYDRKVTELWYSVRELVMGGQLKGMNASEVIQFCTREYEMRGKLIRLDTKDECKKKLGRSPDNADAVAGLCHVARLNGIVVSNGISTRRNDDWHSLHKTANDIHEGSYQESDEFELVGAE